jgi:hypothetical protein
MLSLLSGPFTTLESSTCDRYFEGSTNGEKSSIFDNKATTLDESDMSLNESPFTRADAAVMSLNDDLQCRLVLALERIADGLSVFKDVAESLDNLTDLMRKQRATVYGDHELKNDK